MITPSGVTLAEYMNAIKANNKTHVRLTFTGQNIRLTDVDVAIDGGITLSSYFNPDANLTFGKTVSNSLNVNLIRSELTDILEWNSEFQYEMGVEINGVIQWVTVGYFGVQKPDIVNDYIIEFTAYDRMRKFNRLADPFLDSLDWGENGLTLASIYSQMCTYCGVQRASGDEISTIMNRRFKRATFGNDATCQDILSYIAEANGCYARIQNTGSVSLKWFADNTSNYTITRRDQFNLAVSPDILKLQKRWVDLEDDKWQDLESTTWGSMDAVTPSYAFDGIHLIRTQEDIGVSYPENPTSENLYTIIDNPLLYGDTTEQTRSYLQLLYNRLNTVGAYVPATVEAIGNWLVQSGDIVKLDMSNGTTINYPIFNRTLQWNGGCDDTYETTGDMDREVYTTEMRKKISDGYKYHEFVVSLDEFRTLINDPVSGIYTQIAQTASSIELVASSVSGLSARVAITESAITEIVSASTISSMIATQIQQSASQITMDVTAQVYSSISSTVDSAVSSAMSNYYRVQTNVSITTDGMSVHNTNASGDDGTWLFHAGGARYTYMKANDSTKYTMGIGDLSYYNIGTGTDTTYTNGGIFFKVDRDTYYPEIRFVVRDRARTYPSYVTLQYNNVSGVKQANFYPVGSAGAGSITLGKASNPWYYCYLSDLIGQGSLYIHPNKNYWTGAVTGSDTNMFIQFAATSAAIIFDAYTGTRAKNIGQASNFWTNIFVTNVHYNTQTQDSSREIKHNIVDMKAHGDMLDLLKPVTFVYNGDVTERTRYGLIYEDTLPVFPDICLTDSDGNKSINYIELIPILLKEIQDLRKRVKAIGA